MVNSRQLRTLLGLFVAGFVVCLAGPSEVLADNSERRIATLAPDGSLWMKQMRRGAAAVEKATEGRVKTRYYAGGSQGDERDVVRKMSAGQLDGAALTSVGLGLIYPGIRVLQLPGFYQNVQEVDYVRHKMWPYFQRRFEAKGYALLAAGDVGWVFMFTTKRVRTEAEFKRLKMWRWSGDPVGQEVFDRLGLRGVPLGVPQVLPALVSGRVEAVFNAPLGAIALQWHTAVKYMGSEPLTYAIGGMVMRKKVWEAASAKDRSVQQKLGKRATQKTIRLVRRDNKRAFAALRRNGIQIMTTPPEVVKTMQAQAEQGWKYWVGKLYSQRELDMVMKYRAEFRRKNPSLGPDRGFSGAGK